MAKTRASGVGSGVEGAEDFAAGVAPGSAAAALLDDEVVPDGVPDLSGVNLEELDDEEIGNIASQAEMSEAMGGYTLHQLDAFFRTRGYQLVTAGAREVEEDEDEIEKFWLQVDGLPTEDRGYARITVHRTKPLFFQGFETAGYCATYPLPCSIETIKEKLGGGTYKLTLRVDPSERDSTNAPYSRTAMTKIVHPPYPNVGTLSKDEKAQGLTLAPDMKQKMDDIDERLKKIAEGGNQKQSGMEKAMEAFMVTTMKKMADPPPPVIPEPPPAPPTPEEQIQSSIGLVMAIKKLGDVLGGGDGDDVDPDDDSITAQAARTVKNMETIMSGLGNAMREFRANKTRDALREGRKDEVAAARTAPEEPEEITMNAEEQVDAVGKINEAIGILMGKLMNSNDRAKSIAAELNKKLAEIPKRFHTMVQGQLTDENVFKWIEDWIDDDTEMDADGKQKCLDKVRGRNGKKKIQKILGILRGEDAGEEE